MNTCSERKLSLCREFAARWVDLQNIIFVGAGNTACNSVTFTDQEECQVAYRQPQNSRDRFNLLFGATLLFAQEAVQLSAWNHRGFVLHNTCHLLACWIGVFIWEKEDFQRTIPKVRITARSLQAWKGKTVSLRYSLEDIRYAPPQSSTC